MASTDDLDTNTKFAAANHATFPILADPDGTVAEQFGVRMIGGFAHRWTFYIDSAGKIAYIDRDVRPLHAGTDMAAHLSRLGVGPRP